MTSVGEKPVVEGGGGAARCLMSACLCDRRVFCLFLSIFALVYVVCFCLALPSYIDEAYTFNLATDTSLTHMLSALRNGADGSLPVYGLLVFAWDKIFGSSELSLRLTSGVFAILLVWHMSHRLTRRFAPAAVALAILLVLANRIFIYYVIQARFYGLLLFAFSLTFWSTWDLIESKAVYRRRWLLHALFCGLLWLSHPLGMVYGSILALLYAGFSWFNKTFSLSNAAAFIGGPLFFLPWLSSFLVQRKINVVYPPEFHIPGWHKYWDYAFLNSPIFCGICLAGILLFLVTKREWPDLADDGIVSPLFQPQKHANCQLVLYSLAFVLLLNLVVALLDAAGVIPIYLMLAVRYVLVAAVAYGVIFSAILERLNRMVRHYSKPQWAATLSRAQCVLITALLLFGVDKMWSTWFLDKSARESYYHRVAELAREKHLDVLCESHMNAFFLTTRTSAAEVKYLLEDNFPFRTLLLQIHKFYPRPTPLSRTEFLHCTNDVVLVPFNGEVVIFKARTLGAP
jgi:hypothetical protein